MRTKKSSEFVKKFLQFWICIHCAPKRLYSDNAGEFNNDEARDMTENFNIEVQTTPAYSPWRNGLLNQTLTSILLKVKTEKGFDWETARCWALVAKNVLHNVNGPCQLVCGCTPNLSSVLIDKPPALEGSTMSNTVGNYISALHLARTAFTQSECSEQIRRALLKHIHPTGVQYLTGNKVCYKRPDCIE